MDGKNFMPLGKGEIRILLLWWTFAIFTKNIIWCGHENSLKFHGIFYKSGNNNSTYFYRISIKKTFLWEHNYSSLHGYWKHQTADLCPVNRPDLNDLHMFYLGDVIISAASATYIPGWSRRQCLSQHYVKNVIKTSDHVRLTIIPTGVILMNQSCSEVRLHVLFRVIGQTFWQSCFCVSN